MLEIRDVRKRFGDLQALDGIDLTVEAGEICALLGPNGAGKTTLVSTVVGLLRPDQGHVLVDGHDVRTESARTRQLIGYAPQALGIYHGAPVRDNLRLFGELAGLRRDALRARVDEVATALGLDELMDQTAGVLSGGQQRRVHAAMALMNRPRLVLLDEPTVAADVQTRAALLDFVHGLVDDGAAVVYSTHYLQEVEELDASVALIDRGRLVERGTVKGLVAAHADTLVELRFDGPAPTVRTSVDVTTDGDLLTLSGRDPRAAIADVLGQLGPDDPHLVSIDVVRPSLDSVFLQLTGQRLTDEEEVLDAVA